MYLPFAIFRVVHNYELRTKNNILSITKSLNQK
jgi:hypothetical protein